MRARVALGAALCLVAFAGCGGGSRMVRRPADPRLDAAITAMWTEDIRSRAESGDWLLTRSYSAVGDVIVVLTPGEDFSHGSAYDAERGTIIEAIGHGVREAPLASLVARNHRLVIARPRGLSAAARRAALARIHAKLGTAYDYRGLVGVEDPEKFYCSEILLWSIEPRRRGLPVPLVIAPSRLVDYAEVVYDSGTRDDPKIQRWARQRAARPAPAGVTPAAPSR